MEELNHKRVPVSEEDRKKSYYPFFERELTPPDPSLVEKAEQGPIDPSKALKLTEINRLFEPGYMEEEIGYCIMEDGTGYVASKMEMPGVTAEMFDWWFAWHGLDNLRYKIWDNEDHFRAETQQPEIATDRSLSFKERYLDTAHYIEEDLGAGVAKAFLYFMRPEEFGFDPEKIGTEACATVVCTVGLKGEKLEETEPLHSMVHFLREVDGVAELRSRTWLGWSIKDGKAVKTIPDGERVPEIAAKLFLLHCQKEFSNLAAILPELYEQEHDEISG